MQRTQTFSNVAHLQKEADAELVADFLKVITKAADLQS